MEEVEDKRQSVGRREEDRWSVWDKRIRDLAIWVVLIAALFKELFLEDKTDIAVATFLASMLNVPLVLRYDERRRASK